MNEDQFVHRQEKANRILGLSLLSLGLFAPATWVSYTFLSRWNAVIGAVLLLIPSIILQFRDNRREYPSFISLVLNSLANGLIVSIYYLHYNKAVDHRTLLMGILFPAVVLLCAYIFSGLMQKRRTRLTLLLLPVNIALMIGSIVKWAQTGEVLYSFTFFSLIFSLIYTLTLLITLRRSELSVIGALSIGSYGIMGIIVVVVIALVTDGEVFDCVIEGIGDIMTDFFPSRSKRRNP